LEDWQKLLKFDPLPQLLASKNVPIVFFANRDLLNVTEGSPETLWKLPPTTEMLKRQQDDGSWRYPSANLNIRSRANYNQLETYRLLGELVEKYGFNANHPAARKAAEFLFRFQTDEGDFRGIYGNQYTPNYTAGIMELLMKLGYENDPRIEKGFQWLLSIRQRDGGWAIPIRTRNLKLNVVALQTETVQPDLSRPFSHLVTGVVLRAFAASKTYRKTSSAKAAGMLLASRFFKRDSYPDRGTPEFWTKFTYPFWFTDLLSSLDSLSFLGFTLDDAEVKTAVEWFLRKQQKNGLWNLCLLKGAKEKDMNLWICLAICRVIKRFMQEFEVGNKLVAH
jgi:hypothetical protein